MNACESDNPRGVPQAAEPGNQQERLTGWIVGFVDGEGCFSIGVDRQPDRVNRKGYRTGYQLSHEFSVTQGEKTLACLRELHEYFGVGSVLINERHDNHREHMYRFGVRRRKDLLEVIIPFFRRYQLRTAKKRDFDKFARCVEMIESDHHLTHHGLADILEIVQTMNRQKPRDELIRILRDHTPDVRACG